MHLKYFLATYFMCICYLQAYRMYKESRLEVWVQAKLAEIRAKAEEERRKAEEEAEREAEEERKWMARSHADLSIDVTLEDVQGDDAKPKSLASRPKVSKSNTET